MQPNWAALIVNDASTSANYRLMDIPSFNSCLVMGIYSVLKKFCLELRCLEFTQLVTAIEATTLLPLLWSLAVTALYCDWFLHWAWVSRFQAINRVLFSAHIQFSWDMLCSLCWCLRLVFLVVARRFRFECEQTHKYWEEKERSQLQLIVLSSTNTPFVPLLVL